jgi:hypothetical protein
MASASIVTINDTTPTELGAGLGRLVIVGPATFYIGGSNVDVTNGFPVGAGTVFPVPVGLATLEKLYGICASGTFDVRVLKISAV